MHVYCCEYLSVPVWVRKVYAKKKKTKQRRALKNVLLGWLATATDNFYAHTHIQQQKYKKQTKKQKQQQNQQLRRQNLQVSKCKQQQLQVCKN